MNKYKSQPRECEECGGKIRLIKRGRKTQGEVVLSVIAMIAAILVAIGLGVLEIYMTGYLHYYLVIIGGLFVGGILMGIAKKYPRYNDYKCTKCKLEFSIEYN